ncbi:MAG: PH domain-containing protein [Bacteroidales bacterium]|jgi:hypothetical protein|nr:PH domain-containing protein [Bacteroidales bacterium]MCI2144627.1 PH domain-containing protein [Bacteroidales bacterium]
MLAVFIIIIVFVLAAVAIIAYFPVRTYAEDGNLIIKLGFSKDVIPLDEIDMEKFPEEAMKRTVKIFGMSLGHLQSGSFRNPALGKFKMYVRGHENLVCFRYKDGKYVVNDWRSDGYSA